LPDHHSDIQRQSAKTLSHSRELCESARATVRDAKAAVSRSRQLQDDSRERLESSRPASRGDAQ